MNRKKKYCRMARNLTLPSWLKLRMTKDMLEQTNWMINQAESCGAASVKMKIGLKKHPWTVSFEVRRRYGNN